MSDTIICRECQTPNPLGSKFCNNCGTRLPPSTNIICRNCQTPNPRNRLYCDNCGARLMEDVLPKEEPKAEEPPKSGGKIFSLPTRRPGHTSELDPNALPDWLKTGDLRGAQEESPAEEGGEEATPEGDEPKGKRLTLQELTLLQKTTDELPDWLVDDEHASAPAFEAPKEITTDHFLELLQGDDDLPEGQQADPFSASQEAGLDAFEANLPDWLSDVVGTEETPPSQPAGQGRSSPPGRPEPAPEEEDEGFNWLTQLGPVAGTPPTPGPTGAGVADDEELSSWLSELDEEGQDDWLGASSTATAAGDEELSGWLSELDEGEEWLAASPSAAATGQEEAADWLAGDDEEDWLAGSAQEEEEEEEDWLAASSLAAATDREELPDWLAGGEREEDWLGATSIAAETDFEQGVDEALVRDDVTGWLAELSGDDEAGLASEEAAGAEPSGRPAEPETAEAVEVGQEEALPEWLTGIDEDEEATIHLSRADVEEALAIGLDDDELEPDWLADFAGRPEDTGGQETAAGRDIEDVLGWLAEAGESQESPEAGGEPAGASLETAGSQEAPEEGREEAIVDALYEQGEGEAGASALAEDTFQEGEDDVMPEWLTQLGAPLSAQPRVSQPPDEDLVVNADLPEWLTDMRPDSRHSQSALPGLADSESPDSGILAHIPEELAGAELPEWLRDAPVEPGITTPPLDAAEETAVIPDWLHQEPEASQANAAEAAMLQGDTSPATGEWDALLSELPPARDPAGDLVKADIPEWVQALKPPELTGEKPAPEQELPVQSSGPLTGVRGVIDIEPVIAMPRTASLPPSDFVTTVEQQQQAALLRQLGQSPLEPVARATGRRQRTIPLWAQILLALLLLAAVVMGLRADGLNLLRDETLSAPAGFQEAHAAVDAARGQPVLMAFEYTPAMAAELSPQAEILLAQLEANDSPVIVVSQYAAGLTLGLASTAGRPGMSLGYVPGDAVGLRQLGNCLAGDQGCDILFERQGEVPWQEALGDIALVIVLTGERDSLVNWVEQVGTVSDIPLVAAVTQSLEPVAAPYLAGGRLQGVIGGLVAADRYQQILPDSQAEVSIRQQLNAQHLAGLTVVVLLLVGGLIYGVRGARSR